MENQIIDFANVILDLQVQYGPFGNGRKLQESRPKAAKDTLFSTLNVVKFIYLIPTKLTGCVIACAEKKRARKHTSRKLRGDEVDEFHHIQSREKSILCGLRPAFL